MPSLLSLFLAPLITIVSLPLLLFAIFTTTLAFSTLLIRVLIVYAELFIVVIHNHFSFPQTSKHYSAPTTPTLPRQKSHRSISSKSSSSSLTPKAVVLGSVTYPTTPLARDFEGVGGWRFPSPDDDEEDEDMWTNINKRLELPALSTTTSDLKHKHERSLTGGSIAGTRERPGLRRAKSQTNRARPYSAFVSGTTSPEEVCGAGYGERRMSKSTADLGDTGAGLGLGMNVGKVRATKHRKSSSSSTGSSGKALSTLRPAGMGG
ncbi:hypothetical protein MMC30_007724 [Trapelia coarctata]|nr:hypothetical protein [Trapelia coarctata]